MNSYLIMKITKDLSDIIQKIKYYNKKYEETKKESYYNEKKKYILELALSFENLIHELDYKIFYRFDKKTLNVLKNITDKCMTLYKIESTKNNNIIGLNVKTENLTPYMINDVDNYFKIFEEGIKILTTAYPYTTDEEANKILAVQEMELKKKLGIEVDNDNNFDKVKSVLDKDKKETKNPPIGNLENGINKVLEDYPITTDKVKSVLDKDKKETKNPPVGNLVKQIYDITNRMEYYENKYAQTQNEFFKEMEKNSVYELALELKKFEDIRNSDVAKTLSKENLEKLDEYIHFSNKLINLRNEIDQTKTDEDFNQKDAANNLRSMIETETKNQSLELE